MIRQINTIKRLKNLQFLEYNMESFQLISNVPSMYRQMLEDISSAKKYIYLETYIYDDDETGKKFLNVLIKKAKEGVKIRLLLDGWGGTAKKEYFEKLIKYGAEVRFFKEVRYFIRMFSKNHERNHRKLLLIDGEIGYIGSANITSSCLEWREIGLRMKGHITQAFVKSFLKSWEIYDERTSKRIESIIYKGFHIINDTPNYLQKITENKYVELIRKARKTIMIETPYFIPSVKIRIALSKAVKRKVKVKIIIPHDSDVRVVDLVRNRYLGWLHKKGIEIYYYLPKTLHSKLLIIDDKFFMLGSSNVDYRSFMHQYEINFLGRDRRIIRDLRKYFQETLSKCKPFDYNQWKKRSSFKKILELILGTVRHYL